MFNQMKEWKITKDSIISNEGEEVKFTDPRAFPFFVTHQFGVLCGNNGNVHANLLKDDIDTLATKKAAKLINTMPGFIEEYMPGVDFSDCTFNFDKARKCAKTIKDDIYGKGRVFELEGETVIMFWDGITFEDKLGISESICQEKEIDPSTVVFANGVKIDAFINSPDKIMINGETYDYSYENSRPFIVFREGDKDIIKYGNLHSIHALLMASIMKKFREKYINKVREKNPDAGGAELLKQANVAANKKVKECAVVEGRVWDLSEECGKIVFTLWNGYQDFDIKQTLERISNDLSFDLDKVYYATNGKMIKVSSESYIPSDNDMEEALRELQQIHFQETWETREEFERRKKESTAGFRDTRDSVNNEKLKYDNPQNGYPCMTQAEFNYRTKNYEAKKASKNAINEAFDREPEIPDELIAYQVRRLQELSSILNNQRQTINSIINTCKSDLAPFTDFQNVKHEYSEYNIEILVEITPEAAKKAILSNASLVNELTGNFGDYEGENLEEALTNPKDILYAFGEYILGEMGWNYGRGYDVRYDVNINPYGFNADAAIAITIETPINWDAFNSINEIMDF